MADVWTLLQQRLRRDAGAPLVTSIQPGTGDRTELSAASLANAAAKIGNALRDEFDLEPGSRIGLHLPLHWQRACWLAGAWTASCVVEPNGLDVDLLVAGAEQADALTADGRTDVAVVSLHPFGLPIAAALPEGAFDVTVPVRQQPDAYLHEPPAEHAPALTLTGGTLDQADLLAMSADLAAEWALVPHGRLLVDATTPDAASWLAALAVPVAVNASVVLVNGDGEPLTAQERITAIAR